MSEGARSLRWPKVLAYHSISRLPGDANRICTSPERLESHLRYLERRNLRGVSMAELNRAVVSGEARGLVGLTFDDGYQDFLYAAVPILKRFGFTATLFVITGLIGKTNDWEHPVPQPEMRLLDAEEVLKVSELGLEVGAHGVNHTKLAEVPPDEARREIVESGRALARLLGKETKGFSYPFGSLDRSVIEMTREAGYSYAASVLDRVEGSIFDYRRIPLAERDAFVRFNLKMNVYPQYLKLKRLRRRFRADET